jgi:hypothetical protein
MPIFLLYLAEYPSIKAFDGDVAIAIGFQR